MSSKPNFRPPPYQDVAAERGQGLLTGAWFQMGNDWNGEGFGMPFGVAKPPMQEPAVRMHWAMGFSDLA
jgi:hypothetical protein